MYAKLYCGKLWVEKRSKKRGKELEGLPPLAQSAHPHTPPTLPSATPATLPNAVSVTSKSPSPSHPAHLSTTTTSIFSPLISAPTSTLPPSPFFTAPGPVVLANHKRRPH